MSLVTRLLALTAVATPLFIYRNTVQSVIASYTAGNPFWILVGALVTVVVACFAKPLRLSWQFVWNCFLRPLGKSENQKGRLDAFYQVSGRSLSGGETHRAVHELTKRHRLVRLTTGPGCQ